MFVNRIVSDLWRGTRLEEKSIENPSMEDFEKNFDALDATNSTMLCLYSTKGRDLTIGGGAGNYVVYVTIQEDEFWNLLSDSDEERMVLVNAGGQQGDFPARQVVDGNRARLAGLTFMKTGDLDKTLRWERQEFPIRRRH